MRSRSAFLLFPCSAEDLGWEEDPRATIDLRQEIDALHGAIVADIAERLAEHTSMRVIVYETRDATVEIGPVLPTKVERRIQQPGRLHKRVQEALRETMDGTDISAALVMFGRNPLYPLPLLMKGIELLGQEDDVIVLGEAMEQGHHPSLMWLALKSYHPEVFEQNERWWQGGIPLLEAAANAQALVMTVRAIRDIVSTDDLGYLFHEIEREVLLKQWYPVRTYEVLHRMRRKHLIPETAE